jgi:hypothetical protein
MWFLGLPFCLISEMIHMEVMPMLAVALLVLIPAMPEPIYLETLSIQRARFLDGQRATVSLMIGKPPYTWQGSTIIGTDDTPDGIERTAVLKGWRLDAVREGKRVTVSGVLRVVDHPARRIGREIVPPWTEIRVAP